MNRLFGAKPPAAAAEDIDQMPETPQRGSHHRRAHSDISFRFDDLLLFDPSDLDLTAMDLPSPSPAVQLVVDCSDDSSGGPNPPRPRSSGPVNHLRSLSVDSDFFDSLSLAPATGEGEKSAALHRYSNSMDGSSCSLFESESMMGDDGVKKTMGAEKLSELALIDPRRAKRILANRQSAARSKERKVRYTGELERKVQTLQTEATTLSAQVTMLQRDTSGLTTENKELKMRLQALEQQAQLRDALNEALREEVQRLKIATGQIPSVNGNPFNGARPYYSSHQAAFHQFGNQTSSVQPRARFSDFS